MERDLEHLTIVHVDAERGFSGGEVQVFLLLEGLAARGHRNILVCPPGARAGEEARRRGIDVREVSMGSDLALLAVPRLGAIFRAVGADLVHLHTGRATWLGGLAARRAGCPALTTRRMDRPVRRGWRTRWIYRRLVRRAVAISPAVRVQLAAGGVPEGMLRTIPSAVDDALLVAGTPGDDGGRAAVRAELGVAAHQPLLLTLASLVPRKGIDVLLEALAPLVAAGGDACLAVAGEGPERARLEALAHARGLGSAVRFLGRRTDPRRLLAACDLFVLPSRREGLGVAALEALAAGRAVVASRVGGLGEVVQDGMCGLLVEPGDAAALSAALGRLLTDEALRVRLAAAGPARVAQGHLASQMTAAYESLYREMLAD